MHVVRYTGVTRSFVITISRTTERVIKHSGMFVRPIVQQEVSAWSRKFLSIFVTILDFQSTCLAFMSLAMMKGRTPQRQGDKSKAIMGREGDR